MADVTTLKVYKDMYQFALKVRMTVRGFPKETKYTIGERMKKVSLDCIELICTANLSAGNERVQALKSFSVRFKVLETLITMARDVGSLTDEMEAKLLRPAGIIARQINGWKLYSERQR